MNPNERFSVAFYLGFLSCLLLRWYYAATTDHCTFSDQYIEDLNFRLFNLKNERVHLLENANMTRLNEINLDVIKITNKLASAHLEVAKCYYNN